MLRTSLREIARLARLDSRKRDALASERFGERGLAPSRGLKDDVYRFESAQPLDELGDALVGIFDGEPPRPRIDKDFHRPLGNIDSDPVHDVHLVHVLSVSQKNDPRPSHILVLASDEPLQVCVREPQIYALATLLRYGRSSPRKSRSTSE
jgi:hypothetical protein